MSRDFRRRDFVQLAFGNCRGQDFGLDAGLGLSRFFRRSFQQVGDVVVQVAGVSVERGFSGGRSFAREHVETEHPVWGIDELDVGNVVLLPAALQNRFLHYAERGFGREHGFERLGVKNHFPIDSISAKRFLTVFRVGKKTESGKKKLLKKNREKRESVFSAFS